MFLEVINGKLLEALGPGLAVHHHPLQVAVEPPVLEARSPLKGPPDPASLRGRLPEIINLFALPPGSLAPFPRVSTGEAQPLLPLLAFPLEGAFDVARRLHRGHWIRRPGLALEVVREGAQENGVDVPRRGKGAFVLRVRGRVRAQGRILGLTSPSLYLRVQPFPATFVDFNQGVRFN